MRTQKWRLSPTTIQKWRLSPATKEETLRSDDGGSETLRGWRKGLGTKASEDRRDDCTDSGAPPLGVITSLGYAGIFPW